MDQGNESSSTVGTTNNNNNNKYLAMLPRGLEKPIIESVSKSLLFVTKNSTESSSSTTTTTSFTILNDEDYDGTILKRGLAKLNEKIEKRKNRNSTTSTINSNNNSSKRKKNNIICNEIWCHCPVGTIPLEQKFHISIGYTADGKSSYTCPGQVSGSIWLQITTQQKQQLVTSRCIGPLMSLIHVAKIISNNNNNNNNNNFSNIQTVVKNIGSTILQQSYRQEFDNALRLWKEHVTTVWKEQINDDEYYTSLQRRIEMNQLRYRFSCVRENSDVPYSRQELLQELLDQFGTVLVPYQDQWKVDLTNFDVEIVLIVLSNGRIALGMSLQPYSYHKSRSFDMGSVPPDVTPPYIGGNLLSGVVRLRPTTARIMLELATIKPYELVIDPCCGIGTIPVECEHYLLTANNNSTRSAVSIGGDIVLDHDTMSSAAIALEQVANHGHHNHHHHHHQKQQQQQQQSSSSSSSPSSFSQLSVAWDAAYLPLRTGSVDAVVSDLPFGKMCLSSSTLEKLLPLIMHECARVLLPGRGRMVLLCGSPDALFRALAVHSMYWKQPCTMIAPVNIGGLLAWMCRIERSNVNFIVTDDNNDDNTTTRTTTKGENKSSKELIRAMTKKRDVRRYHDSKKRRVQSKS